MSKPASRPARITCRATGKSYDARIPADWICAACGAQQHGAGDGKHDIRTGAKP